MGRGGGATIEKYGIVGLHFRGEVRRQLVDGRPGGDFSFSDGNPSHFNPEKIPMEIFPGRPGGRGRVPSTARLSANFDPPNRHLTLRPGPSGRHLSRDGIWGREKIATSRTPFSRAIRPPVAISNQPYQDN